MVKAIKRFLKRRWWIFVIALAVWLFPQTVLEFLPMLFMFALQLALNILMFGLMFFYLASRTRIETYLPGDLDYSWDDYRGHPEIVEKAKLWVQLLKGIEEFEALGGHHVGGVLLVGPPGSGKTHLARIVAAQAGVPFLSIDCATLQGTFVGISPLRVIQVFRRARRLARDYGACILCLDEIDAIGRSRSGIHPRQWGIPWGGWGGGGLLTTLFIELDGLREARGRIWHIKKQIWKFLFRKLPKWKWPKVMVMAMTNVPELLDPALTRPGRLSRQIKIDPPTLEGAKDIIEYYLEKVTHDESVSVEKLALDAIGQVPAKIEEAINTALELAYASGRKAMSYWDWRHALNELVLGLRQPVPWEERDRERLAYHEAGHAVVTWLLQRKDYRITSCSIVRYGSALGHLTAVPTTQLFVKSVEEASASLAVLIGGRAAEELVFGMPMGSLGGDMKAIRSVLTWMAEHGMFRNYRLGQETSEALQEEMNKFLRRVREETIELLRRNRNLLDVLAKELMQREEIIGEEVEKLLEEVSGETSVLNSDPNSKRSCRVLDLSASSSDSAER